ncbi:MAG: carboxypeptidase-like regulatory domain-containing protein [Ignavibacteriales bacterium]|nr:carboxypeptidase-like regulatory domain-containing protein [Ignavibacteriales bacterium]
MINVVKFLCLSLYLCLLISISAIAQDKQITEVYSPPVAFGPIDTSQEKSASGVLAEYLVAADGASEYRLDISWAVQQACFWGGPIEVWLYRNDVQIFYYNYGHTGLGYGWTHGYYDYVGPGKSYTYKLVGHYTGAWGCDYWSTWTDVGSTKPIQPPVSISVTNPTGSDKFINMSWGNGSELTNYYKIYEDGAEIGSTYSTSYTVSTTPGNSSNWGVATVGYYSGWYTSSRVEQVAATVPFIRPENFFASEDTTVGYVRLGWTCTSDYATHFQIFRDDILLTTIPVAEKSYLDYSAVPGQRYTYQVRSYNNISGLYSSFSDSKFGRAVFINASDGSYDGKVYVNWTNFPDGFEDELKLYRDGVRIDGVFSGQVEKNDELVVPGKIHEYKLEVLKNTQIKLTISNYGFAPADGSVKGFVTTPTGLGGVKNVEMRAYTTSQNLSRALSLDGVDDYVSIPALNLNSNTVTMSAWIKRNGTQNDWAGILYSRAKRTAAGLHILSTGELRYNWNDQASTYEWSSGLIVPDNEWTFIALVVEPDKATIYMNDTLAENLVSHSIEEFDGYFEIGIDAASSSRYFNGLVDEICIWNTAKTAEQLAANRNHIMRGNETGLVGYWRFNPSADTVAGDYATNGDHHGVLFGNPLFVDDNPPVWHYGTTLTNGSYTIARINWEEDVDFTVRPYKRGHGFKGSTFPQDSIALPFTQDNHIYTGINFLDTTSIEVSGWVLFESDSLCPVPGVKILVNGTSTGEYTDSTGHYSISVAEAGNYTISVEYLNHKFLPASVYLNIQDPVTNLIFSDTTKKNISGKVSGGCDNFLGATDINIKSLISNCFETTLHTDSIGAYQITLPAQKYIVQLTHIDHPDSLTIINYFAADTIDISEYDTTYNFIYHSPPITKISDLPPAGCGVYNVPILQQEVTYAVKINVTEKYGDLECQVDSGNVTIYDYVAYDNQDTIIKLGGGIKYYPLTPGYPNITGGGVHPYQKRFVVKTEVDKYTLYDTVWVFVRGQKPREFQFSTVSPEIPLMILRDPPGDQSYSYISSQTSSSVSLGFSFESEVGVGIFAKFKVGGGGEVPGLGSTGAWLGGEVEAKVGLRNTIEGTQEIKISTTKTLKTSDADAITGADGDVYMGAALNIVYAKTDIIDYDSSSCSVALDTGIVWNGNGFKTTYLYTESYIRESVIPGLQSLADVLNSSGVKRKQDSAKVLLNQIDVWQQVIDYNAALKNNAVPIPEFPSNVSFSAGTNLSEEATITSTSTLSIGLNLFIDAEVALSIGAKAGDFNEAEAGVKIFAKLDIGVSASTTYEVTNTIGFELADDDAAAPGDAFTVDILGDPVYGTPVFKLLSGASSCPWEHPTLPREGVGLSMNTYSQNNVPPEMPASFDLYLYNLTQNNETRTYLLSIVQGSNPDGVIIQVGGAILGDDQLQFSLPPNAADPQRATLRVMREVGSVYDYENLMLHLYSPCDDQFDTTVAFSVHFTKPCSDVRIVQPSLNWIINANNNNQMAIVLKDYNAANMSMQQLKFEYRLNGANDWIQLFNYPRALLPADSILYNWDMTALSEGIYELRASTHCSVDSFFTRTYAGVVDRIAPSAFGNPQPSDGILNTGDDIKIQFSENINCATSNKQHIKMHNVSKDLNIDINILCKGDELVITPKDINDLIEGDTIRIAIDSLSDLYGNILSSQVTWDFVVDLVTDIKDVKNTVPTEYSLDQNYPNPFNPITEIRYGLPEKAHVSLKIYDLLGRELITLVNETQNAGFKSVSFDANDLPSGMFFYKLQAGNITKVKKMLLIR